MKSLLSLVLCFSVVALNANLANAQTAPKASLATLMKESILPSFKILGTHLLKQNSIATDGSTLKAAIDLMGGLTLSQGLVPSKIENAPDKAAQLVQYDQMLADTIAANAKLIEALKAQNLNDSIGLLKDIMKLQKAAHTQFKND